jgi:hypothetical protein
MKCSENTEEWLFTASLANIVKLCCVPSEKYINLIEQKYSALNTF